MSSLLFKCVGLPLCVIWLSALSSHSAPMFGNFLGHSTTPGSPLSGSVSPQNGGVVRKPPQGTPTIVLENAPRLPPAALPPTLVDVDRGHPMTSQIPALSGVPIRPGSVGSSLPARAPRTGKKISECRRKPKLQILTMVGCMSLTVDVGTCQGACRSREGPTDTLTTWGNAFAFNIHTKCRTCRAEFEIKHVEMVCRSDARHSNHPPVDAERRETVAMKVIRSCSCARCTVEPHYTPYGF